MWTAIIWLELLALALLLWAAVVRACAHFITPWLRYFSGLGAWLIVCLATAALAWRHEAAKRFLPDIPEFRRVLFSLDALLGDQGTWQRDVAVSLVGGSLLILLGGLSTHVLADGSRVPRVRRRSWTALFGGPLVLGGLLWAETIWIEKGLRDEVAEFGERGRGMLSELDARHPPFAAERNASDAYRRALEGVESPPYRGEGETFRAVVLRHLDWHGDDLDPLTPEEEPAARRIVAAGKMTEARFRAPSDGDVSIAFDHVASISMLMLRRAAHGDDRTLAESIGAMVDLATHLLRKPTHAWQFGSWEFELLATISILAQQAPERLTAFDPVRLAADDAEAILAPLAEEADLVEAENSLAMSRLFEPDVDPAYSHEFVFGGRDGGRDPGDNRKWYLRFAAHVVRLANVNRSIDAYRPRMDSIRRTIDRAVAAGRPDATRPWTAARFSRARTIDGQYDFVLDYLIEQSFDRFAFVGGRRLGNVALAAARFTHRHGRLPTAIDELVPDFLAKVPEDPFTGEPVGLDAIPNGVVFYVRDPRDIATNNRNALLEPGATLPVAFHMTAVRLNLPKKHP